MSFYKCPLIACELGLRYKIIQNGFNIVKVTLASAEYLDFIYQRKIDRCTLSLILGTEKLRSSIFYQID